MKVYKESIVIAFHCDVQKCFENGYPVSRLERIRVRKRDINLLGPKDRIAFAKIVSEWLVDYNGYPTFQPLFDEKGWEIGVTEPTFFGVMELVRHLAKKRGYPHEDEPIEEIRKRDDNFWTMAAGMIRASFQESLSKPSPAPTPKHNNITVCNEGSDFFLKVSE